MDQNGLRPSAFPRPEQLVKLHPGMPPHYVPPDTGMSLRDYFAAQALSGAVAGAMARITRIEDFNSESCAQDCYEIADAMLKAREEAK